MLCRLALPLINNVKLPYLHRLTCITGQCQIRPHLWRLLNLPTLWGNSWDFQSSCSLCAFWICTEKKMLDGNPENLIKIKNFLSLRVVEKFHYQHKFSAHKRFFFFFLKQRNKTFTNHASSSSCLIHPLQTEMDSMVVWSGIYSEYSLYICDAF